MRVNQGWNIVILIRFRTMSICQTMMMWISFWFSSFSSWPSYIKHIVQLFNHNSNVYWPKRYPCGKQFYVRTVQAHTLDVFPQKFNICFAFYIIFSTKSFSVLDCITCHIFTHVWFFKYFKVLFLNFFSNPCYTLRSVISYFIHVAKSYDLIFSLILIINWF